MKLNRRNAGRKISVPVGATSDIAFLLLIFIMVVALLNFRLEVAIDHAEAETVFNMTAENNLEIWIDRAGAVYLDGHPACLLAVHDTVSELHLRAPDTRIHIIADRNTPYMNVNAVLEILQLLQYRTVSFVVNNVE